MAEIMRLGSSEFEVLERSDANIKLKSVKTGLIRDADPLYAHLGYCTRQEYLCKILLHEPLRGYSDDFVVIPVRLWWFDIIDVCVNSRFTIRITTKENWREMLKAIDLLHTLLGENLTEINQRLLDCWVLTFGFSQLELKPYTMLKAYKGDLEEALKASGVLKIVRLQLLSEEEQVFEHLRLRLLQIEGMNYIIRVNDKVMRVTTEQYQRLLRFLKYCPYVKTFDGESIRYYDEEDNTEEVYEIIDV